MLKFVCVLTNERYKTYQIFILAPGSCPRGELWGAGVLRGGGGSFIFSNMVIMHIKSTGMTNKIEFK